jgi:hypothetical protein
MNWLNWKRFSKVQIYSFHSAVPDLLDDAGSLITL